MKRIILAVAALIAIALFVGADHDSRNGLQSAAASTGATPGHGLETGFGDYFLENGSASDRAFLFDQARDAGAGIVRLEVSWRGVTKAQPNDPGNPADPAYDFSVVDAAVRDANAHGLDVMLTVAGAPTWAEGPNRPSTDVAPSGTWQPNPSYLGDFAHALASRYSGRFAPAGQPVLPRVRYYEVWNEPNLPDFLSPQWQGAEPVAVDIYRLMLNAFYDGIKGVNPADVVIAGTLEPYGDPPGQGRIRPLLFLRDLFCLKGRKALKPTSCPDPAKFDVLSHHPIDSSGGPTVSAINPDDAATPDLYRVRQTLQAAEREHTLGTGGHHPLWATEFWWESNPPDRQYGAPLARQARWIEQALYLIWKQGASVAIMFQVRDDPYEPSRQPYALQSGILFNNGKRKPSFTAFRFPFVIDREGRDKLRVWGKTPSSGTLTIERRQRGGWQRMKSLAVSAGGVYVTSIHSGGGQFRAVLGKDRSLVWRQG